MKGRWDDETSDWRCRQRRVVSAMSGKAEGHNISRQIGGSIDRARLTLDGRVAMKLIREFELDSVNELSL
jgi:hypothetical protein